MTLLITAISLSCILMCLKLTRPLKHSFDYCRHSACIFFHLYTFQALFIFIFKCRFIFLPVCFFLAVVGSCFFIQSDNLCLSTRVFRSFILNLIINMAGFNSNVLLSFYSLLYLFFVPFFSSFG